MKKTLLFITILGIILEINAQYPNGVHPEHKRTNVWHFGEYTMGSSSMRFDFNSGNIVISEENIGGTLYSQTSISDTAGNFMFNLSSGAILQNSNADFLAFVEGSQNAFKGAIFVPVPNNDSLLLLFYSVGSFKKNNNDSKFFNGLKYTIINAKANGGLGEVLQQDIQLLNFAAGSVTVAYHSNGEDFWLVSADTSSYLYSWLIDSTLIPQPVDTMYISTVRSLFGKPIHSIVPSFTTKPEANIIGITSTDLEGGVVTDYTVSIISFDNTTGVFENEILIESHEGELINGDYYTFIGSFSPHGDWWYVPFIENPLPRNGYIKRYGNLYNAVTPGDVINETIYTSVNYQAPYTVHVSPLGTMLFYTLPAGGGTGATPYVSTILYPDSTAPVVLHENINTGAYMTLSPINNLPMQWYYKPDGYSVGKEKMKNENFVIYPNPANERLFILNGFENIEKIIFYDIYGKEYNTNILNYYEIDLRSLKNGIYFLKICFNNGSHKTKKIVVQH